MNLVCLVLAFVCFLLGGLLVPVSRVNWTDLGFAFVVLSLIFPRGVG
jgi:hypothetical protein